MRLSALDSVSSVSFTSLAVSPKAFCLHSVSHDVIKTANIIIMWYVLAKLILIMEICST